MGAADLSCAGPQVPPQCCQKIKINRLIDWLVKNLRSGDERMERRKEGEEREEGEEGEKEGRENSFIHSFIHSGNGRGPKPHPDLPGPQGHYCPWQ